MPKGLRSNPRGAVGHQCFDQGFVAWIADVRILTPFEVAAHHVNHHANSELEGEGNLLGRGTGHRPPQQQGHTIAQRPEQVALEIRHDFGRIGV